ncbi:cyclase family protein [Herpetosiphon llansteffanensis]|uniref:cyclase family protein n=1 Tax=Herpetosiphon llansteffanensis TaxID=2094568 RepID=UPI0013E0D39C|nr:cyclase family protein [Herpetosiphon llansteffanensis]
MANLIDISVPISPALPVWEGDPPIEQKRAADMNKGDICNVTRLNTGVHIGTHVDAPLHFINNDLAVESLELDHFIGDCYVVELTGTGPITGEELAAANVPSDCSRLLLKTSNSAFWQEEPLRFHRDFRALDSSAARWVIEHDLRLIAIDYLSIEPFEAESGNPTHCILLGGRVGILEGINLTEVEPGAYNLICLPLKILGSDGAPARAVLQPR